MSYLSLKFSGYNKKRLRFVYSMLIPIIGWMFIFNIFPILYAFYLSLFQRGIMGIGEMKFVGFVNYGKALFDDEMFWFSFKNTLYYVSLICTIHLLLAFFVALGLYKVTRHYRSLLVIFYFSPIVIGMVVGAVIFSYLYDPNVGLFNTIITFLGLPRLYYLTQPSIALPSLFIVNVWLYLGFDAVIFLAALQNIPQDIHSSARVDGANSWQTMLYITLPLMKPIALFLLITTFVGSFQIFSLVWMLTPDGGPLNSTTVLMLYIYNTAFQYYRINYACALTYIMFMVTLAITMVQLKIGKSSWQY